jgi:hypothetical protein
MTPHARPPSSPLSTITLKPRVEWYTRSMSLEYEPASTAAHFCEVVVIECPPLRCRPGREQLTVVSNTFTKKNGSSQDQNRALTGLLRSKSLGNGMCVSSDGICIPQFYKPVQKATNASTQPASTCFLLLMCLSRALQRHLAHKTPPPP